MSPGPLLTYPATYEVLAHDAHRVMGAFTASGAIARPSRRVELVELDSIDGRIHAAGLRLVAVVDAPVAEGSTHDRSNTTELVLSGRSTAPAHLVGPDIPRVPADLPIGPFRSRLSAALGIRALLERVRVEASVSEHAWTDAEGKVVVVARWWQDPVVIGTAAAGRAGTSEPGIDTSWSAMPEIIVEVQGAVGHDAACRDVEQLLDDLGPVRIDEDLVATAMAAAGVEPAGVSMSPVAALDPEMTALDGMRAVLARLAEVIDANWEGTARHLDPEFLHDLRVAVRRSRAVLSGMGKVLPSEVSEPAAADLARIGIYTGPARDLDVALLEWERSVAPLGADAAAALEPVRRRYEERHREAYAALENVLRSDAAIDRLAEWRRWLTGPIDTERVPPRASRPLGPFVAHRIDRAQRRLLEHGRLIDDGSPAEDLHRLRKDAKRLRYLLECFAPMLPTKRRKQFVSRLKDLQEILGAHQDAEVQVTDLAAMADELSAEQSVEAGTLLAIGRLIERTDQRRVEARAAFTERFARYDRPSTARTFERMLEPLR